MALASGPGAIAGTSPQLRIVPTPIAQGAQTTAFGSGFCSSSDCSKVSIVLDGNTVASGPVDDNGRVAVKFTPQVLPDHYTVTARQSTPDGTRQATTGLSILAADTPDAAKLPAQPPSTAEQRDSKGRTAGPPASRPRTQPDDSPTITRADSTTPDAQAADNPDDPPSGGLNLAWVLLPALALAGLSVLSATVWWLRRRRADSEGKTVA